MRHTPTQGLGTLEGGCGFMKGRIPAEVGCACVHHRPCNETLTLTLSHKWERGFELAPLPQAGEGTCMTPSPTSGRGRG